MGTYDDTSTKSSNVMAGHTLTHETPGDSSGAFDQLSNAQQRKMKRAGRLQARGKLDKAEKLRNKATYGTNDPQEIARMKLLKRARAFDKDPESFGVSEQERQESLAAARQAGETEAQGIQTLLARKEMSGAGIMTPGALQTAARAAGSGTGAIAADAQARLSRLHTDRINSANAEILAALGGAAPKPPTPVEQASTTFLTEVAPQIAGDLVYGSSQLV
jgi:hypothetical protein